MDGNFLLGFVFYKAEGRKRKVKVSCALRDVGTWWNVVERGGNVVERGGTWWNVVERGGTWWNVVERGGNVVVSYTHVAVEQQRRVHVAFPGIQNSIDQPANTPLKLASIST